MSTKSKRETKRVEFLDSTMCSHAFNSYDQMRSFGRDSCNLCGEWIHREDFVKLRIKMANTYLKEVIKVS